MPDNPQLPIIVSDQVVSAPAWTVFRYVVSALGTLLANKGILSAETVNTIVGALMVAVPVIWGTWLSIQNKQKLIVAARAAPDPIAQVK